MNYPRAGRFWTPAGPEDAGALHRRIMNLKENYPEPFLAGCMNLLSSHDVPRAKTLLGGADDAYERPGPSRSRRASRPSRTGWPPGGCGWPP